MEELNAISDAVNYLSQHSWRFCRSYLQNNGLTTADGRLRILHGLLLPEIVQENSTIWVKSEERKRRDKISFSGVTIIRPRFYEDDGSVRDITPKIALRKKTTYECEIRGRQPYDIPL